MQSDVPFYIRTYIKELVTLSLKFKLKKTFFPLHLNGLKLENLNEFKTYVYNISIPRE